MRREVPALVRHNADAKGDSKAEQLWMQQLQKKIHQKKLQSKHLNVTKELGDNSMSKMFLTVKN